MEHEADKSDAKQQDSPEMTLIRHTAILRALLEALECRDIDGMMRADPELVRAVGEEIAKAAKLGAKHYSAIELAPESVEWLWVIGK